jgi:enoyl-CoA hydratase/carnithine racemase
MESKPSLPAGFVEEHNIIHGISDESLLHIKINRPEKKNAFYPEMYETIRVQLKRAKEDDKIKAVLVYGSKGNFSAGNDLSSFLNNEPPSPEYVASMLWDNATFDKPVFYFVQGCCVGVITTMVAWADFVYVSDDAFFVMPFMSLNLVPEGMSSIKYPEIVGRRKAAEMLFLEHRLTAQESVAYRLANGIIPKEKIPATEPIITDISKIPGLQKILGFELETLRNAKRLMLQGQDLERLKKQNWDEQQAFYKAQKSDLFKDTVNRYVEMLFKSQKEKGKL